MKHIEKIVLFSNGNTAVFDESGEQVGELQKKGWMELWFEWMELQGVDVRYVKTIEMVVNGKTKYARPFKIADGSWNVEFIDF